MCVIDKFNSLTRQTLIVNLHVVNEALCVTTRDVTALVDKLTARLVVTQRFNRQPVLRVASLHVFLAVIDWVWRTARNSLVTARLQELTVDGAGDEDGASVRTGQTDGVLVATVSAVNIYGKTEVCYSQQTFLLSSNGKHISLDSKNLMKISTLKTYRLGWV